jgi:hypothetical protein
MLDGDWSSDVCSSDLAVGGRSYALDLAGSAAGALLTSLWLLPLLGIAGAMAFVATLKAASLLLVLRGTRTGS